MNLEAYIIDTHEDFVKYFSIFAASCKSGNDLVYCCGLDLEYISIQNYNLVPNWINNKNVDVIPCVLQVSSENCCLVLNLKNMGLPLPNKLIQLLTSEAWIKMGIGIGLDLYYLSKAYNLGHCKGELDIKSLCLLADFKNPSLTNTYNYFTGQNIKEKQFGGHNWTESLTDEELDYAIMDAYMSYKVGSCALETVINRLKKNTINIVKHKAVSVENYISRLNEYAQSLGIKSFPQYKSMVIDTNVQVICTWKELTDHSITHLSTNKMEAKQECARQMLTFLVENFIA